jgi:N-acetylglucosaminyl-diphospho-decaprenol L-rhamnosyltransferase
MVARDFPSVRLIACDQNLGFTRGNNRGLAASEGRYILFLNPDTVVLPGALAALLTHMEACPATGILGPQLLYGNGSLQPSRRRFPTLATALLESSPLAWRWPHNRWARRYNLLDVPADRPQQVDWVVGAAILVRRAVVEQIGGFDEGFFMYSEETDLCRRAAAAGWRTWYLPSAQIIHYEGKSSEQVVAARHIHFQTSRVRYFRKHHGRLPAEILRGLLLGQFALEWLLEAAKRLLRSRPDLRRERMTAYSQLLRHGLRQGD